MARRTLVGAVLGLALLGAGPGRSDGIATDVNIVTGIDVSDSVPAAETRAELAALAAAIRAAEFLAAIRRGHAGRVRVAVFAWHHRQLEILPWTSVGSSAQAEAAARIVEARILINVDAEARKPGARFIGRLTDLSRALDHAALLAARTNIAGGRVVVNIVGNGADNMGRAIGPRGRGAATGPLERGKWGQMPDRFRNSISIS